MRAWILPPAKTSTAGALSAALSVLAHALLVAAAVHTTAISANDLADAITQRLQYLPPPDRRPSAPAQVEHLEFVALGGGSVMADKGAFVDAERTATGNGPLPKEGNAAGSAVLSQAQSAPEPAPDSVYSILEVEERATRTAGSAAPVYPPQLMSAGTQGSVFVRFVVDTTGRADPESIVIVRSTDPAFSESVKTAIPLMTFLPAMVGKHHVRQAVEQSFEFRITAPVPVTTPATDTRGRRTP